MVTREITVVNNLGIHARPASLIVQAAMKFKADVTLVNDTAEADAKSIMNVMMLAAGKNAKVSIRAKGPDEVEAVDTIAHLFASKFNEE